MKSISIAVQKEFCEECSMALRRFLGKMDGVNSIETGRGEIAIEFDEAKLMEEDLLRLTRESIEKLGYKIES
ncbi:MAG TPA: heavy-metal-associated domain-containing protein [Thermodesulfovibrionales bacterium]|nr:heavy-metal-associated domain-containing protein [Thermodesulfovibrionales bacterium]